MGLTEEEEAESDLMASEILAESQVDVEEGPEQVPNIFKEGSFFPNEDLLVSTQDQTTDVVKGEVESKEKTRRKTKEGQLKDARKVFTRRQEKKDN